jgi:predicted 3-demethylubiquinone-9 3-methyltransferase (glyoxalase superfamily)
MATNTTLRTFLWFPNRLEEALAFYRDTFRDFVVHREFRQELDQPLFTANFSIYGHEFSAMNWAGGEAFTNAVSFSLWIDGQEETDRIWTALTSEGVELNCGWCRDKFGLTWQVSPIQMRDWLEHSDSSVRDYAWKAMESMTKIVIDDLHE